MCIQVMCICNSPFGGPGCTINIADPPDFFLSQTCCDVRNYKCDKISGYGYPFARKTKLYYQIIFSEVRFKRLKSYNSFKIDFYYRLITCNFLRVK